MSTLSDLEMSRPAVTAEPEPVRVAVFAPDDELRAWLVEELTLMAWKGALDLVTLTAVTADALKTASLDLLIVDLDRMSLADVDVIATRTSTAPVIGIGTLRDHRVDRFEQVLGPRLTSRELKRAIRTIVFDHR
jgi:hypothetical protein